MKVELIYDEYSGQLIIIQKGEVVDSISLDSYALVDSDGDGTLSLKVQDVIGKLLLGEKV